MGGRSTYKTLSANLCGGFPSTASVSKNVQKYITPVKECDFRFEELNNYLKIRNLPKVIWIAEDGTRITGKIQYDVHNNQISGFVSPLNEDGLPVMSISR